MIWYINDLADNPAALLAFAAAFGLALVLGIAFHEFCHAWAASELGDQTAARQGRLTLNPMVHLEPMGILLLLIVGFGWGKPTPVNPYNLRIGAKAGNALVALAGPASNFVFATIAAMPIRFGLASPASLDQIATASGTEILGLFLFFFVLYNVLLGTFNLIPIHPLDGFKVATGVLPRDMSIQFQRLAPYGPGILMTLIVVGLILPQYNVLAWIILGVQDFVFGVLF
ncbi:MAG: site-2 protease family protein [Dehalococcoidia bacterium]|nr:site-2 protease family protein [Dehalococcoidia bacterium]